jgi:peptidoglycan hydrolase-like protein with peptidoglycan-binding domain
VVEAGYQHKVRLTTVAVENKRAGIKWVRLSSDIGELSGAAATYPVLRQGDRSDDVKTLATLLNKAGWKPALKVTGYFGPVTAQAVKWFQTQRHLEVDGIVGKNTWAALRS